MSYRQRLDDRFLIRAANGMKPAAGGIVNIAGITDWCGMVSCCPRHHEIVVSIANAVHKAALYAITIKEGVREVEYPAAVRRQP
jgi:hypothetical protein